MKQYHRYRMDFDSKWSRWSAIFMGAAVFVRVFYYLGLNYLSAPLSISMIFNLWLPLVTGLGFIVLLRGVRFNAPGVYAILGVVICILLLIGVFSTGNVLRMILGIAAYTVCGAALIFCTGGYVPGTLPAAVCFFVVLVARILFFDLGRVSGTAWLPEISDLCYIAALVCLPLGMVPGKE